MPERMWALSVRVKGEIVSACIYDADYKLYYVATSGDYANVNSPTAKAVDLLNQALIN